MALIKRNIYKSKKAWLKARRCIGGSDAAAILGLNPYKNNVDLWLEKTGESIPEDISDKEYVRYGIEAENPLIELFKLDFPQYQVEHFDNNMFINEKLPFAHASLDGELTDESGRKGILEIKTTNILQSMQKENWKDKIPDNYYVQVLHYLMVTGYDFAVLKAQLKSEFNGNLYIQTKHYFIEKNDVLEDIKFLEQKEKEFWDYVVKKQKPPLVLPNI